jgi:hypothetical protein
MSPPASTWTVYRQPPQATAPLWASRRHDGRPRIVEKWKRDLQHLREMTLRSSLIIMRCMNNMSICTGLHKSVSFFALLVSVALGFSELEAATPGGSPRKVMLILRGVANSGIPRGQLDDQSALEYAKRVGFRGEVLDVAGDAGANSAQFRMALDRIRRDVRSGIEFALWSSLGRQV